MRDSVPIPTGVDLLAFLGWTEDDPQLLSQADRHVAAVAAQAAGYCGGYVGVGNSLCQPDVAAVIVSAAARSLSNPAQAVRTEAGAFNEVPGSLASFSLLETLVLNRYRRRTA